MACSTRQCQNVRGANFRRLCSGSGTMPCVAPFFLHTTDFVDDNKHNCNAQKFWFLVLGVGLFTKRANADQHCDPDDVLIFFTKELARHRWGAYCRKRHTHNNKVVPDGEEDDGSKDNSINDLAPAPCPVLPCSASVKLKPAATCIVSVKPASHTRSVKPSTPVNASTPAKHPISTKPPVSVKPSPTSPPAISPSVSSVSSISTVSLIATHQGHRAPSTVASSAGTAPACTSLSPNAAATASDTTSTACAPLHHFGSGSSAGELSASIQDMAESSSTCLLYNSSTRKIYKDAEQTVQEMGMKDMVQVVDCEDLVGYCAGKAGKMTGVQVVVQ
ncbi:hypothetical protein B0H14DRAFT_2604143 [Mycena olivaceomarginata]|nr:hypothetical protein B0H14DRAFT_2604143 [Mycena olivaceomarginata]